MLTIFYYSQPVTDVQIGDTVKEAMHRFDTVHGPYVRTGTVQRYLNKRALVVKVSKLVLV